MVDLKVVKREEARFENKTTKTKPPLSPCDSLPSRSAVLCAPVIDRQDGFPDHSGKRYPDYDQKLAESCQKCQLSLKEAGTAKIDILTALIAEGWLGHYH